MQGLLSEEAPPPRGAALRGGSSSRGAALRRSCVSPVQAHHPGPTGVTKNYSNVLFIMLLLMLIDY